MVNKSRGLALGIVALLTILGGVAISILTHVTLATVVNGYQTPIMSNDDYRNWETVKDYSDTSAWTWGFSYIIPGVILLLAALIQRKAGYIISSIFGLLAVLVMGIAVIVAGLLLIALIGSIGNVEESCMDTMRGCVCNDNAVPMKQCHYITDFFRYCIGLLVCIILSWILLLVASILAIVYSCRSDESQPGMVYSHLQEQQVVVGVSGQVQMYPQPYAQPMYAQGGAMGYVHGPAGQAQDPAPAYKESALVQA